MLLDEIIEIQVGNPRLNDSKDNVLKCLDGFYFLYHKGL